MNNKKKVTYSLDKDLIKRFNKFVGDNAYNKSYLVEKILKEYLEKENNKKK